MSGTDQISKTVGTAFEIAIIDKFVSLTHTISVTSDLSTATSEDELDQKNFGQTFSNDYFTDSELINTNKKTISISRSLQKSLSAKLSQ